MAWQPPAKANATQNDATNPEDLKQAQTSYYDPNGNSGTGQVKDIFNTQTALFGGSADAAAAARQSTFDTAGKQVTEQTKAYQSARQSLADNQAAAEQLASQSGLSLQDAYRALGAQQNAVQQGVRSEADAVRSSGVVDTSGLAQQQAAVAGLDRFAAAAPGPSGVSAAASQARQQTLQQALAGLNAGRGTAAAGAAQNLAMGQAAAAGAQTAATAGSAAAAENQAYQARRLQAIQAAGGIGGAMQQQRQQLAGQALSREQAAAGIMGSGDSLLSQYQQQMAAAEQARAGSQMNLAQLEAQNANIGIGLNTTYAQQQGADLLAALGYRQNQLATEDQLRVQGITAANSTAAGMQAAIAADKAKSEQADKAQQQAMIGTGLMIGAAMA